MKIAINRDYGGFGLSEEAYKELSIPWDGYGFAYSNHKNRTDPALIKVIEKLGKKASGRYNHVIIKEIPDGAPYEIEEYDGYESVIVPRQEY
jgi:hypothetical protein